MRHGDQGVGRIEAGIGARYVQEAAREEGAEREQHHGEHHLHRNEAIADVAVGWLRQAAAGSQHAHGERGQGGEQGERQQAAIALKMKFEGNVVGGGPAEHAETAAQPSIERHAGGGARCHQHHRLTKQRSCELPSIRAQRMPDGHLAMTADAACQQ